jgi:hypothetical protein
VALNLGELAGIISLDEKPALSSLGRVQRRMEDTARSGQASKDKMQAQVNKYEAAVQTASENIAKSKRREEDAAGAVRAAEVKLAEARKRGADDSSQVVAAMERLATAHRRVADAQENTVRVTREHEAAQSRLASSVRRDSDRMGTDFSKVARTANQAGQAGITFARNFGMAVGGLAAIAPAAGAAGSALLSGAGNAVTFAASLSSLGGVAALIPAGLMAVGAGAGTLIAAFNGIGDALKEVNKVQSEAPKRNPRLDAMAVEDAMSAIKVAEENAAQVQVDAARRVSDAKRSLQDVVLSVSEAQKAALRAVDMAERDEAKTARDVASAQKDLAAAREEAASQVKKVAHDLAAANLQAIDSALAYKKAVIEYNKAKADPTTLGSDLAQLQNNVAKSMAANEDAKQQVIDLKGEQKKAQQEAKTGSDKVLTAEQRLADARQAAADAVQARKDAQADVLKQERDGARQIADAQLAIKDAVQQGAQAQKDAARSVEQAHRNLERVQLQQADAATQAGAAAKSAMDKLTPSAREAVIALLAVKAMLGQVRDVAQENFFKGFSTPLMSLAQTVIPQLVTGVGAIASALGAGAQIFMRALENALGGGVLDTLLQGVADSVTALNGAITPIVDSFTTLGTVGMNYMPQLAQFIADLAAKFNTFIQGAAADGSLKTWIDGGIQGFKDLWSIAGSVVGIFKAINTAATNGGAVSTLGGFADGMARISAIMNGTTFQTALTTIFDGASKGSEAMLKVIGPLGDAFVRGAPALSKFLDLGGQIVALVVGHLADAISNPGFGAGLVTFMNGVKDGVAGLGPTLPGLTKSLGDVLAALAPFIAALTPSIGATMGIIAAAAAKLTEMLSPMMTAIAGSPAAITGLAIAFGAWKIAMAGISLFGFLQSLGMLEGMTVRSTVALVGQKIALGASRAAAMAAAAGQWLLNAALSANPIGLVVLAIAGLVAGLVWFFTQTELGQQIVQNVWGAIQVAVAAVVDWFQNTAMPVIQQVFKVVGAVFTWLYQNVIKPAWEGIGNAIKWAWENILKPTFSAWVNVFKYVLGPAFTWLWKTIIKPAFDGIGSAIKWVWDNVLKPTFDAWNSVFKNVLGPVFNWLWKTIIKPAFDGIGASIKWVWNNVVKPVFDTMHKFITKTIPDAFKSGVGFIKTHWDKIQEIAKAPVKFVVDTVLNKGLIAGFNGIADFLHIGRLPPIVLPKGFSDGGYTGNKPTGAVAGVVHGDEHVIRSESRRKVERTHPGLLDHLNRTGNVAGYRDGGRVAPLKHMALTQGWNHVHKGIDLAASVGTPVFATEAGRVSWAGPGVSAPGVWGGNEIHIDGGSGIQEWFAHMSSIGVRLGQMVRAGQQIGLSGNTGITSGPHLHFGTFAGGWPNDINPLDYLGGAGVPSGGTGGGGFNPIAGIIDGLVSKFKETFPGGGAFADMTIGVGKKIMDGAAEWVTKTLGGGDKKGNATGMAPTVYDGGGWLHNTGGPQLVQHNKTKPDAVLTYEELQMFKAAARNGGGIQYSPTYQYMGEDPETLARRDRARLVDLMNAVI